MVGSASKRSANRTRADKRNSASRNTAANLRARREPLGTGSNSAPELTDEEEELAPAYALFLASISVCLGEHC